MLSKSWKELLMKYINKQTVAAAGLALVIGASAIGCYYDRGYHRDYDGYAYGDPYAYGYDRYGRDDWQWRRDRDSNYGYRDRDKGRPGDMD